MPGEDAARRLGVDPQTGLSPGEARDRLAKFGPNQVTARPGTPGWLKFLQQFNQALVYILVAAAAVSGALGEWVDASVILGVVLINAIVGYIQESRAEKAIDALAKMVPTEATARRGGRRLRLPAAELVPGDLVLLQSGDSVPADLRLIEVRSLHVEEAPLTGESVPVQKAAVPLPGDTPLADRNNLGFAGTLVTYGQASGIVIATGDLTEMGRIATMISRAADLSTPLTRKIAEFSRLLLCVILGLATLTFLIGWLRGVPAAEVFMASVALAVGAIPEGLPAAVTITLAIGVARMARRHAIIRKMPAVETLGSTTVICSDKTGTLTENQMTVSRVWAGGQVFEVTGGGYEPAGEFLIEGIGAHAGSHAALRECLTAGLLCNDSQILLRDGRPHVDGDPTEAALIVSAAKAGIERDAIARELPRLDVIPFESEHMFMATLHRANGSGIIYKKGSVERLLDRCATLLTPSGDEGPIDADMVHQAANDMASQGLRVLAFARRRTPADTGTLGPELVGGGLTLLGLQGMIDPPRPEAIRAVAQCQRAGIQVKMITGDHGVTAAAIGSQLGLCRPRDGHAVPDVLSGQDIERIPDAALAPIIEKTAIFARVAPEQKLRLVRALQGLGHVVAMTGDGVNDAPALKQADIGIAMGITGTDVAKGASDMILADDNFASIEAAVEEGRNVFDNLTKFIAWTMPTNGGEGLLILVAILAGTALPVLPVQLLWVNMSTALLLGLMLVFEPKERDIMDRPPRDPRRPILTHALLLRIALVSVIMVAGAFALFVSEIRRGASLPEARTAAVNVIVVVEAFYLFNCRSLTRPLLSLGVFSNPWLLGGVVAMMAAQLLFTHAPLMNRLFHTSPISGETWLKIAAVGAAAFLATEAKKWLAQRAAARRQAPEQSAGMSPPDS